MLARLLALARAPGQLAEAEVTVGHERALAQFLGEGQGLAVMRLRAIAIERSGWAAVSPSNRRTLPGNYLTHTARIPTGYRGDAGMYRSPARFMKC